MPESNRTMFSRARAALAAALVTGLFAGSLVLGGSAAYAADEVPAGTEAVVAPVVTEAPVDEAPVDGADPAAPVVPEAAPAPEPAAEPAPAESAPQTAAEAAPAATEAAPAVAQAPTVEVVGAVAGLDPSAETVVTVKGSNFLPSAPATNGANRPPLNGQFAGTYVVFGSYLPVWKPSEEAAAATRSSVDQKWAVPAASFDAIGGAAAGAVTLNADGSFETTLKLKPNDAKALAGGSWGIVTYPGGGAKYAPFETFTPVTFAAPAPTVEVVGAVTGLDPSAETVVTVKGKNFLPSAPATNGANRPPLNGQFAGTYVVFGSYLSAWKPSEGALAASRSAVDQKWAVPAASFDAIGGAAAGAVTLNADGSFETTLKLKPNAAKALADGSWGIATYPGGGAKYAPFETFTPVTFAAPAPTVEVVGAVTGLDPSAETVVTVKGSNFLPSAPATNGANRPPLNGQFAGTYVVFGSYLSDWKPSEGAASTTRSAVDQKWAVPAASFDAIGGAAAGAVTLNADGSFETTLKLKPNDAKALAGGSWGIVTYPGGGAKYAPFETFTPVTFATPVTTVVTGTVSSVVADESLTVAVAGSGFKATAAYVALIERGTEGSLDANGGYAAFALPFPVITDGVLNVSMVAEKAKLDRTKQYEVLVWKQHSAPTAANIYARADVEVSDANWDAIFGKIEGPKVSGSVTKVTDGTSLTIGVSGTGFTESTAYAAIIERGTEAALGQDGGYAAFAVPFPTITDGVLKTSMVAEKAKLDRTKQYEVLVWKQHTQPTADNILARSLVSVSGAQWDQLFGKAPEPKPPVTPAVPAGPTQPGSLTWGISSSFGAYVTGNTAKGSITTAGAGGGAGGYVFPQSSSSSWDRASQTGTVQYSGVVSYSGHHGLLSMSVSNPMIRVTSPTTGQLYANGQLFANLNLGAASRSVAADGSVTWRNVPVAPAGAGSSFFSFGSYAMAMDGLSFTVGAVNTGITGGTTVVSPAALKSNRQPAATAPATSGIRILTPADELVAGGAIEFEASGFEPGERGILVVLYSDPIVLDRNAGADANGVVRWIGTLPQDLTGSHTLTLQGTTNAGAEITIAKSLTKEAKESSMTSDPESQDAAVAAVALSGSPMAGSSTLWWAAAAALVLVAGALVGVVLARRRVAEAEDSTTGSSV